MGTPALIIQKVENGYRTITCSMDGYPGGNGCGLGHRLLDYYNDETKVNELMELGCVKSLGNTLAPHPSMVQESTDEEELKRLEEYMNYSSFFHRDLNDDPEDVIALKTKTLDEATEKLSYWAGYNYLYQDGKWNIVQIGDGFFTDYLTGYYECLEEDEIPDYSKTMEMLLKDNDIIILQTYMDVLIKLTSEESE